MEAGSGISIPTHMYCLSEEKQLNVLRLLVEGNSISGVSRITGVHRDTCMRLMVRFGHGCQRFLDREIRDLELRHIEIDEIWTFVGKRRRMTPEEKAGFEKGIFFIFVAFDEDTKLVPAFKVGRRTSETTNAFVTDLASRLSWPTAHETDDHAYRLGGIKPITRISSDGYQSYPEAIDLAFGRRAIYAQIIKDTDRPKQGLFVTKKQVFGRVEEKAISTSLVERNNLTIRTFMKRLVRRSLCFSKKVANLEAATAMHFAFYNYCWRHKTLGTSPAVAAGLAYKRFTLEELVSEVRKLTDGDKKQRLRNYNRNG